ncbi:MAG: hypothetical protein FJ109_17685 [Deltaproteobacteria bacterium]|nr:hypothetical protein [Deltaproteobacteria bacterium]
MKSRNQSRPTLATSPDIELLCQQFEFLVQNRERILADPLLARCRVEGVCVGFSFSGAIETCLGKLLEEWAAGRLTRPCRCGGTLHLLRGGGGLSGHSVITGWCPNCRMKRWIELGGTGVRFLDFIAGVLGRNARQPLDGALSLRQVCEQLRQNT